MNTCTISSPQKKNRGNDPFIKDRINAITRMRLSIKDIEEEIDAMEKTQPGRYDVL